MNISSVSTTSSSAYASSSSSSSNDEITQLEKEKASLQKEIQKENQSKDDAKTKQEKVKGIQTQIQQIEAQIQQLKTENSGNTQNAVQAPPPQDANKSAKADLTKQSNSPSNTVGNNIDIQI
ncbi:MAG: FlxA-like protein [Eubacterium sp.]|jgi:predicted  nucleic acid-binding Zn-ribbon protein|nr:FlxA-like protein [Eubacterium sp.]